MLSVVMILVAVLLDYFLGEPQRYHPLAGFGRMATWVEAVLYGPDHVSYKERKWRGVVAWAVLVSPLMLGTFLLSTIPVIGIVFQVLCLYLALGATSLFQHARIVARSLQHSESDTACQHVAMMAGRDTRDMDDQAMRCATVESVLENGNNAIFATLFWFVVLGGAGAVFYRLVNMLGMMWGYGNRRYIDFGRLAARMNDVMNWLPARLTALSYALIGNTTQALQCWKSQARLWQGRNAGIVMASGAGAMNLSLGGPMPYQGAIKIRPALGHGLQPQTADIERSVCFVQKAQWLWLIILFLGGIIVA